MKSTDLSTSSIFWIEGFDCIESKVHKGGLVPGPMRTGGKFFELFSLQGTIHSMMLFLEELFIIFRWFLIDEDEAAVQEQGIFWLSEQSIQKYFDYFSLLYPVRSRFEGCFYENENCPSHNEKSVLMLRKCIK